MKNVIYDFLIGWHLRESTQSYMQYFSKHNQRYDNSVGRSVKCTVHKPLGAEVQSTNALNWSKVNTFQIQYIVITNIKIHRI